MSTYQFITLVPFFIILITLCVWCVVESIIWYDATNVWSQELSHTDESTKPMVHRLSQFSPPLYVTELVSGRKTGLVFASGARVGTETVLPPQVWSTSPIVHVLNQSKPRKNLAKMMVIAQLSITGEG